MSLVSFERTGTLKPIPQKRIEQKVNICTFWFYLEKPQLRLMGTEVMTPHLMRLGPVKFGRLWQVVAAF